MFERGWSGSREQCTTLVMRYLLMSRVENEVNNDLRSSLLGRDSINGLYKQNSRRSAGSFPSTAGEIVDLHKLMWKFKHRITLILDLSSSGWKKTFVNFVSHSSVDSGAQKI